MNAARRLKALYREALEAHPGLGSVDWYRDERRGLLSDVPHVSPVRVLRAAAALSPRVDWQRVRYGLPYLALLSASPAEPVYLVAAGQAVGFLGRSVRGALRELRGDAGGLGKGPKVNAFSANLQGAYQTVTVDVWAARAAGVDPKSVASVKGYREVEKLYQGAAWGLGVPPALLQARVWVYVRELGGMERVGGPAKARASPAASTST